MNSLFNLYGKLWPASSQTKLEQMLSDLWVLHYPEQKEKILLRERPETTVVIVDSGATKETLAIAQMGFEHVLERSRPDFPQELLVSALMALRPKAWAINPIPFFFTGFGDPKAQAQAENHVTIPFHKTSEKAAILQRLEDFLQQNKRLKSVSDLCLQSADEIISNALYNAPVDAIGRHIYRDYDRTQDVALPTGKAATFFACFSDYRVIIGCEDLYGSLQKESVMRHFARVFGEEMVAPNEVSAGAGLGFKYMIENAANFYLYCEAKRKTVCACGFLLQGVKANLTSKKHFHVSIR